MPVGEPQPPEVSFTALQLDYQVTQDMVKLLTDIRFRLLTILPPLSGGAVTLLSYQTFQGQYPIAMLGVGLLGFVLTLGLVLYDQRNSDLYNACVHRAKMLERIMRFPRHGDENVAKTAQPADSDALLRAAAISRGIQPFPGQVPAYDPTSVDKRPPWSGGVHTQRMIRYSGFLGFDVAHGSALSLIYGALLGAWIFPIARGALVLFRSKLLEMNWVRCLAAEDGPIKSVIEGAEVKTVAASLMALIFSYAFIRCLAAMDVPGTVDALYEKDPSLASQTVSGALTEDGAETWKDNVGHKIRDRLAKKAARSWFAWLLVSTVPMTMPWTKVWLRLTQSLLGRLVAWLWKLSRRNPRAAEPPPRTH